MRQALAASTAGRWQLHTPGVHHGNLNESYPTMSSDSASGNSKSISDLTDDAQWCRDHVEDCTGKKVKQGSHQVIDQRIDP